MSVLYYGPKDQHPLTVTKLSCWAI